MGVDGYQYKWCNKGRYTDIIEANNPIQCSLKLFFKTGQLDKATYNYFIPKFKNCFEPLNILKTKENMLERL